MGESNTRAGYLNKNGNVHLLRLEPYGPSDAYRILSSVLYADEDGNVIVGWRAEGRGIADPLNMIRFSLEFIGDLEKIWTIGGKTFNPTEVATEILRKVKERTLEIFKYSPDTVVNAIIAVPVYFSGRQKNEIKKAGIAAGLNVLQIITEPMAIAVAAVREIEPYEKIFVLSMGHKNFDMSVLEWNEGNLPSVLAADGDKNFGEDDFDKFLSNYFIEIIKDDWGIDFFDENEFEIVDTVGYLVSYFKENEETLFADTFVTFDGRLVEVSFDLSYEDVLNICKPFYDKIISHIENFIDSGFNFSKKEISKIILAGGGCYIPKIKFYVEEIFDKQSITDDNLECLTAYGVAIIAASFQNN